MDLSARDIAVPLRLLHGDVELAFISTATTFGTAVDVTVAELMIESFFPADARTAKVLRERAAAADRDEQPRVAPAARADEGRSPSAGRER